ncbi:hypothetical protein BGZ82_010036 [Podila clonocystis]|nr:hypothetical protein BGZ82_010036 [Podila clonocystis]
MQSSPELGSVTAPTDLATAQVPIASVTVQAPTGSAAMNDPTDSAIAHASTAFPLVNATTTPATKRKNAEKIEVTTETLTPSTITPAKHKNQGARTFHNYNCNQETHKRGQLRANDRRTQIKHHELRQVVLYANAKSSYTPIPASSANAMTPAPARAPKSCCPAQLNTPAVHEVQKVLNTPQHLSYTKRPDFQRLQHDLKLHKLHPMTPQPPAMIYLKRYLERGQAKAVFKFLSKYKPETVKQRTASKLSEATNSASEKKTVPLLKEVDLDDKQGEGGDGDIGTHTKDEELEDDTNKENK